MLIQLVIVAQPLIPALGKQLQADFCEFEASLHLDNETYLIKNFFS